MKIFFSLIFLLSVFTGAAQECEYDVQVENEDGTGFKLTKEKVVFYQRNPITTNLVYFSLYEENDIPLLLFKFSRDSKNFPESICIDGNSRLSFQLANGEYVSLRQVGEDTCGYIDNIEGLEKNNNTLESFFHLTANDIEKLKESKIIMMALRTPSDKEDFVIASELDLGNGKKIIPGNYFIEFLKCIE